MRYEHHRYQEKVCLVTGAANGLGLNLTNRLLEEGAVVGAVDIEADTLERESLADAGTRCSVCPVTWPTSGRWTRPSPR